MDRRRELLLKYRQKTISREEWEELLADLRSSDFSQYEPWMDEIWQNLPDTEEAYPAETDAQRDAAQRDAAHPPKADQRSAAQRSAAQRVYAQLQKELALEPQAQSTTIRAFPWARVAAVLLLSLGAIFYFFLQEDPTRRFVTAADETRTLILPDSSIVTLNERSELTYARQWDQQTPREVWLTGEAYFSVKHTASDQKFIVHTDPVAIEVLGTEFNVHNRSQHPEVTLTSGSVQLSAPQTKNRPRITMKPGEQVILTEAQTFRKSTVNPAVYAAWKQQELVLDNTPLSEVARLLERQHEIQISIPDSTLRNNTLTGTYPNQNLEVVLDMLSDLLVGDARIERKGEQITIRRKNSE